MERNSKSAQNLNFTDLLRTKYNISENFSFLFKKKDFRLLILQKDANVTAEQIKSSILTDGKVEIERLTSSAKAQIGTIEARVRKQISDYVATLALQRITMQLEGKLNSKLQQKIIDRNISKLAD